MIGAIIAVAAAVDAFVAGVVVGKKWPNKVAEVEAKAGAAVAKEVDVIARHNPEHIAAVEAEVAKVSPAAALATAELLAQAKANAPK